MGGNLWVTLRRIRNISRLLKDSNQPFFKKFLIIFGIIYLLSPLDLVPEPVFGIGIVDDIILWAVLLSWLGESLDAYSVKEKLFRPFRFWPFGQNASGEQENGAEVIEVEGRIIEDEDEGEDGQEAGAPSEGKEIQ